MALLQRTIRRHFGAVTAAAFMLCTALQFHLPFYLSRTLPNVLAMPLTNAGLACWLEGGDSPAAIYLLTAAAVSPETPLVPLRPIVLCTCVAPPCFLCS